MANISNARVTKGRPAENPHGEEPGLRKGEEPPAPTAPVAVRHEEDHAPGGKRQRGGDRPKGTVAALSISRKSEAHVKAARARWGEPRTVRLDALDPRVKAAVLALIRADEAARAADSEKAAA